VDAIRPVPPGPTPGRVRLGIIRDFPVAGPEDGGSWRRPGTVDRLLDHVSRNSQGGYREGG
jgi:hypothetical protein